MASLRSLATVLLLLAFISFSESARPSFVLEYEDSSATDEALAETGTYTPFVGVADADDVVSPEALDNPCHTRDIDISQFEVSGVGIPVWAVQITNLCTNPRCMISQVIVQCGAFHSPTLVNPHVFRRLDVKAGTCIVLDGHRIGNADTVSFQYSEIMKQPLTLRSAKVTCR